jgi:hypothetical protein
MPQRLSLDQLQIREPCHESWESMRVEDGSRRHCDSCVKHVHDLSALSRVEVEQLLMGPGELPCVRFARGDDGRVLTREDFAPPVVITLPARRPWLRRVAALAATLGFGSLFNLGCSRQPEEEPIVMGGIAPSTMPSTRPVYPGQAVMGDITPIPEPTHTKGKPAPPTTQPSNDPIITGHTVGIISAAPPPKLPPEKAKAATPKRSRPA